MRTRTWKEKYLSLRPELADATATLHAEVLDRLARSQPEMKNIGPMQAREYVALLRGRGMADSTAKKHVRVLKTAWKWAIDCQVVDERSPWNGIPSAPAAPTANFAFIDDVQFGRILAAASSRSICLASCLAMCRFAGMRKSEALHLMWQDVDLGARILRLHRGARATTKARPRDVPITPALHRVLVSHLRGLPDGPGTRLVCSGLRDVNRRLTSVLADLGIKPWPKLIHTLRKCCEAEWLRDYPVMDVCRWLGHSPTVAMRHYHQTTGEIFDRITGRKES